MKLFLDTASLNDITWAAQELLLHPLTDRGLDQFLADGSKLVARAKAAV